VQYKFVSVSANGLRWEGQGPEHNRRLEWKKSLDITSQVDLLKTQFLLPLLPQKETRLVCPVVHWNDMQHQDTERDHTSDFARTINHKAAIYCTKIGDKDGQIWVGSCPRRPEHIKLLREKLGITAVVNLQEIEDIHRNCEGLIPKHCGYEAIDLLETLYSQHKIKLVFLPTKDMVASTKRMMMTTAALVIASLLRKGHVVYVHCNCGIGRAIAAVAAYFVCVKKWAPEVISLYMSMLRPICYFDMKAVRQVPGDFAEKYGIVL